MTYPSKTMGNSDVWKSVTAVLLNNRLFTKTECRSTKTISCAKKLAFCWKLTPAGFINSDSCFFSVPAHKLNIITFLSYVIVK